MTRQRWTLLVVCAATAMLMLDIAVVNTALSDIGADLDAGLSGLQWVVDAYTVALAAVVLTAGSIADRLGRKRVFVGGLVLFSASSAACAFASDIVMLDVARAVQGLGAAAMFACSLAILADAFPGDAERASALAAYGASIGAAFAVGPLVGGALTTGLGWEWIFLVNVPIGIALIAITLMYVRESVDPLARPIDWPGQVALGAALVFIVTGLLRGNEEGWGSGQIVLLLGAGTAFLITFAVIEIRVAQPMLPLGLFRNRAFTGAQVAAFAISSSFFAVFLYTTLYLQQILGLSAIEAGLVYLPATIVMFLVSGATASLGDKVSQPAMVTIGLLLVGVGMALAVMVQVDSSWTILLPTMVIAMIGTGLFNPAVSAIALSSVPMRDAGLAAGVNDTFRQAGIAVGVAGLGALFPSGAALGGGDPQAYVDGFHNAAIVCAVIAISGAVVFAALMGRRSVAAEAVPEAA
ncbi:MAG: MFS transporter [Solirubrobacteraceae bacterium]|nr:MFS transporter [Solirubrobacteraceae bacterium]